MKKKGFILLAGVLVLWVCVVWAEERCEAPTLNIGDQWTYGDKSGTQWNHEVIGIENGIYLVRNGERFGEAEVGIQGFDKSKMNHVFEIDKNNRKTKFTGTRSKVLDFPLYVGKKWRNISSSSDFTYRKTQSVQNYSEEYLVSSYEDVKVAAGTFKAFKIEYRHTNMKKGQEAARTTYWYSPEVKAIVKRIEFVNVAVGNMELISYKLAQ